MKVCEFCGKQFQPRSPNQKFCKPEHRFAAAAKRDPTNIAGRLRYGRTHRQLRAQLRGLVESGRARCSRCGEPILSGERWDLDHSDDGRGYRGPSHADCNRRTSTAESYEDDPAAGVYWGPPATPGGKPTRWSRAWYDWREKYPDEVPGVRAP
jgi:hypothetical protein